MKTWRRKREGRNCINVYEMLKKLIKLIKKSNLDLLTWARALLSMF